MPTAPGLTVAATTGGILLTWDAVPHAVRYELWTWWDAGVGWQPVGGANLTGTTWTHTTVTAGTTYYYSIRALNAAGDASAWLEPYPSATALAVTGAGTPAPTATATPTATSTPTPPAASGTATPTSTATPTDTPTAPAGAVPSTPRLTAAPTTGGILLTWQAVPHAVRYELWTWWDAGVGWQPVGGTNLTGTTWTHTTVTAGTTYYYSIRAVNAAGEASAWLEPYPSATASAHAGAGTPTPTPTATSTATATSTVTPTPGDRPTAAVTERGALIALYEATGGASWTQNNNWLSAKPLDSWYGVATDANGRVTDLKLRGNGLNGPLPDLSALTELEHLFLDYNELSGPLPDLNALSKLEVLRLSHNKLSGPLPDLSALTELWGLYLSYNELSGEIPDLSALSELEVLRLSHNELSGPLPDLSALTELTWVALGANRFSGGIPDLSALSNLRILHLYNNRLTGPVPDLSAFAELSELWLDGNLLSGPIPDLSALTSLKHLILEDNELSGEIPDLGALAELKWLILEDNELSGSVPDVSGLTNLEVLQLARNRLSGPLFDLSNLTSLMRLDLAGNRLSGPLPDLRDLTRLARLSLESNRFCLPAGASASHANSDVDAHLKSLNLPACTAADLAAYPAAPSNLSAAVADARVTLAWDAVAHAAGYELRAWDSLDRRWRAVGGLLTVATYTHAVLTDGRNYYYQVRARDAAGVRGPWTERLQVLVVPQRFPPPPPSLGLALFYQKYMVVVEGVFVAAPSEVSDEVMIQAGEVFTAMLSTRPDLLQAMADFGTRIFIYFENLPGAGKGSLWFQANVSKYIRHCRTLIHEYAHMIHFEIQDRPGGPEYDARVLAAFNAALDAGLYDDVYASTNYLEYWAEIVVFWFQGRMPWSNAKLADYDPVGARLVEEVFGAAAVPAYCIPPPVEQ